MTEIPEGEKNNLVALMKLISPRDIPIQAPKLPQDLKVLIKKPLPRRPLTVVFDVYGTLVVSGAGGEPAQPGIRETGAGDLARARLEELLTSVSSIWTVQEFDQQLRRLIQETREALQTTTPHPEVNVESLLGLLFKDLTPTQIRQLALVHEAWKNPCAPMPGAFEILKILMNESLPYGLISNAQFYTPILMEALFEKSFDSMGFDSEISFFSFELGIAKPNVFMFKQLLINMEKRGIPPEKILYIGNSSENDIAPAKSLGLMTALFAADQRSFRPSPYGSVGRKPDTLLAHWNDLPKILGF